MVNLWLVMIDDGESIPGWWLTYPIFPLQLLCLDDMWDFAMHGEKDLLVIVRLDDIVAFALFIQKRSKQLRELLDIALAPVFNGELMEFFGKDSVQASWIYFCTGGVIRSIGLFSNEGNMCSLHMCTSSHVAQL